MSISIHYSGKLRNPSDLSVYMNEVIDLCQSLHWRHQYLPPDPEVPIEGVIIYIEGCDPVVLTFLPGGRLCHPFLYPYMKGVEQMDKIETAEHWIITHTQDAGPDVHMNLIRILHYLHEKYFDDFKVNDSSQYWETNDEQQCRESFVKSEERLEFSGNSPLRFADGIRDRKSIVKRKLRRR
ncbi:MAG: hypothetical protein ABIQ11_05730 [Saprospiraceae bacterium]